MFWKLFYKLKGVEGLNEAIDNGNIKDSANFLKVYLDRPFDNSCDEPFKIFDFIDDFVVEDKDYELCEQMMIGSKYFETMTSEKVILALDEFSSITTWGFNTEKFSRYLISKIPDSDILLNESLETVACLYECYSGLGIEDFIIDLGKIYVIKLSSLLGCSNSKELLKYCRGTLFEEEIKEACIKGNLSVEDIFDLMLDKYDTSELDVLFEIIMSKNKRENPVDDITRLSELSVFKQFLDELNKDEKITEEHKNYLALKLLESKNGPRMLDWLANVECESNKLLIDELVGKASDFTILFNVSKQDVSYALERVLQFGNIATFSFPTADALFIDDYGDIEKLNLILDGLFKLKPNVKFSKNLVIDFLKKGVNKFPVLINQYELTDKERLEVLQALRKINSDWLIIYGAYLVSGDSFNLMLDYVANEQMMRIRELKGNPEEV